MAKPKKILNDPKDSVEEFIEGLLLQFPNHLVKLENHNVVFASNAVRDNDNENPQQQQDVHLICGGGSGHEPSHAGFLGAGMLSGAVCGGIFASPSVSSVLSALRAVANSSSNNQKQKQILLVIKNYTGDRLNFGMAAEKAGQEGIRVQTVVVAEDCALPRTKGITGARGVAGTVFVNKIAGAAAASGKPLDEVARVARLVCSRMGTLGIAMDSVTVPGAETVNDRLDEKTIEVGLGIHGEAGMKQSKLLTANECAREMISTILNHGREEGESIVPLFEKGDEVAVLVNNLGGTSNFEMSILAQACIKLLESDEFGVKAKRVFVGSFMTSFDMHGASLTILNVTGQPEITTYLDAPTTAPAWLTCDVWSGSDETRPSAKQIPEIKVDETAMSELKTPPLQIDNFEQSAKSMILSATKALAEAEPELTKYDTIVGDGDCGITMKRGATEVSSRLEQGNIPTNHPVPMFASLADAVSASMGGTSGVLLELMFRKMSSHLSFCESIGVAEMSQAVQAGVDAVSLYGGAHVGSRTMLDALVPAAAALVASNELAIAAAKAREGADGTAKMATASAGRSNYLSEDTLKGTPDPGACAVSIVLEGLTS